jgi:integrase
MPRKPTEFTESLIKSLLPEDKVYVKAERGLVMRVYPSGTKTWSYYKTAPDGTRKEHRLGNYPDISLKEARELSQTLAGEMIKKGMGIETNKKGMTFGEYMLSDKYQRWSRSNRKAHKFIMDNLKNVVPTWIHRKQLKHFSNEDFEKFVEDRQLGKGFEKPAKASTINRNLNNIRSVFRHAFDNKEIKENPMDRFSNLKETDAVEKLSLTDDERTRLLAMVRDRSLPQADKRRHMELFVELGLTTGMRNGELVSITWGDIQNNKLETIDFPNEGLSKKKRLYQSTKKTFTSLKIDYTKGKPLTKEMAISMRDYPQEATMKLPVDIEYLQKDKIDWFVHIPGTYTKNSKKRKVGIPDHLAERIREYLWDRELRKLKAKQDIKNRNKKMPSSLLEKYKDYLTHDENMNVIRANNVTAMGVFDDIPIIPYTDVKTSFNNLCNMAGLKNVSIHTMRHDFCTRAIKKGIDIYAVKKYAGHGDIRTTMKYVHALDQEEFEDLEKLHDFN